jgi:PEP-CTERM motif
MTRTRKYFFVVAVLLASTMLAAYSAKADQFDYTFSGNGSGTVNGVTFTNQNFTFVLAGDTSAIDSSGAPYYRLYDVGGTFTEGGSTENLVATIEIVGNAQYPSPPTTLGAIDFFNATFDNGLGLVATALNGYNLSTAIGPLTGDLSPTLGGGSFATTTGSVSITADNSLTFTAGPVPSPEPGTIGLLAIGLVGLAALFHRRLMITSGDLC